MNIITDLDNKNNLSKDIFVDNVIKTITSIIKNDPKFSIKKKIEVLENIEKTLIKKEKTFISLLESSESFKNSIKKEIDLLESSNDKTRIKLIKDLKKEESSENN